MSRMADYEIFLEETGRADDPDSLSAFLAEDAAARASCEKRQASTLAVTTVPVEKSGKGYCQHGGHGIAVLMPAGYRETSGARRFLCERHALPAIAEFGVSGPAS